MKKMTTLYARSFENRRAKVVDTKPVSGLEWVEQGEGIATEKIDGACTAIINGEFYKRYDAKQGKPIPEGAIPCQEKGDEVTGHLPCWVKCDRGNPSDKHFWEAYDNAADHSDGTYEAIGVSFQGNPYCLQNNLLERHGSRIITDLTSRDFNSIKTYLETHNIEGIVFWKDGEPQCKIKRSDFGFEWNKSVQKHKDIKNRGKAKERIVTR